MNVLFELILRCCFFLYCHLRGLNEECPSYFNLDCVYDICSLFSWETFISEKCLVMAIRCISKVKIGLVLRINGSKM